MLAVVERGPGMLRGLCVFTPTLTLPLQGEGIFREQGF